MLLVKRFQVDLLFFSHMAHPVESPDELPQAAQNGGPYAHEYADAPYRETEDTIQIWVDDIENRGSSFTSEVILKDPYVVRDEYVRLGGQIIEAGRYPTTNGVPKRERDLRRVERALGLFRELANGEAGLAYDLALDEGGKLVSIILGNAHDENEEYDREKARQAREEEHAKREEQLRDLARHDSLTGALNRLGALDVVNGWCTAERRREGDPRPGVARMRGIVDVDLTDFKTINTVLGESVGDQLLVEAVRNMLGLGRDEDAIEVVRQGGDEFRILVGNVTEAGFDRLCADLHFAQEAKVANERQQQLWESIKVLKEGLRQRSGGKVTAVFNVAVTQDGDGNSYTALLFNGVPIMRASDMVVLSFGAVYGEVRTVKDYEALALDAREIRIAHKQMLHEKIGLRPPRLSLEDAEVTEGQDSTS